MTRLTSGVVKVFLFVAVILPAGIGGCDANLGATVGTTAATTFVATIAAAVANAIVGQITPAAQ